MHERCIDVIDLHALPGRVEERRRHRRALVTLHPGNPGYLARYVEGARGAARAEMASWAKAHPEHARQTTRLLAQLDLRDGKLDAAVARWRRLLVAEPLADDIEGRYADFHRVLERTGRLAGERARSSRRAWPPPAPPSPTWCRSSTSTSPRVASRPRARASPTPAGGPRRATPRRCSTPASTRASAT